jgi:hypothetical protein
MKEMKESINKKNKIAKEMKYQWRIIMASIMAAAVTSGVCGAIINENVDIGVMKMA